jgi:hypothetical protein
LDSDVNVVMTIRIVGAQYRPRRPGTAAEPVRRQQNENIKRLKELEIQNRRLKNLVADLSLDIDMLKELAKVNVSALATHELVSCFRGGFRWSTQRLAGAPKKPLESGYSHDGHRRRSLGSPRTVTVRNGPVQYKPEASTRGEASLVRIGSRLSHPRQRLAGRGSWKILSSKRYPERTVQGLQA